MQLTSLIFPVSLLAALTLLPLQAKESREARNAQYPTPVSETPATAWEAPEGAWTLAVIPDTQHAVEFYPEVFYRQMDWLAKSWRSEHIKFAVHQGDITNNNSPEQWKIVHKGMRVIKSAGLPFSLGTGNKDHGAGAAEDRSTKINDFLTPDDYGNSQKFGLYEKNHIENSWHLLDTPTGPFIIFNLEFGPRDGVLKWADGIAKKYAQHRAILVTHAFLKADGTIQGSKPNDKGGPKAYKLAKGGGDVNDGWQMWEKLIKKNPNFVLILNGHYTKPNTAQHTELNDAGRPVQMLYSNYQRGTRPYYGYGGAGYTRLLRFLPDGVTVEVKTYSPWYDKTLTTDDEFFTIQIAPAIKVKP